MSDIEVVPELSQLVGAMIFCSETAVSITEIRRCLHDVADAQGGIYAPFGELGPGEIREAVKALCGRVDSLKLGFSVVEVAGGFRLQSDSGCGVWVRQLLKREKPNRLSRPALETLAIIAYRQPISRAEIESVRGVAVGNLVKSLMEMQLVRISGRSEMPGRPFLYGTTTTFLDHFGLKSVEELKRIDPSLVLSGESSIKTGKGKPKEAEFQEPAGMPSDDAVSRAAAEMGESIER